VVAGTGEEWVKRCEEALRAIPHFQDVASSGELFPPRVGTVPPAAGLG